MLIILATISINAVLGENGLIKKAQQAKELHEQSIRSEDDAMNALVQKYENAVAEPPKPEGPEMPSTWDKTKVTAIDDGKGNPVPLPKDFYYVGGNIDTGIVISDKQGDTIDAKGVDMGNQFVWIPATEESLTRTEFDSNGQPTPGLPTTDYIEPYTLGYSDGKGTEEAAQYDEMKRQVLKYGGFYFGRFEAGVNDTSLRTGKTTTQSVVSKKGVAPYNYTKWGKTMSDITSDIELSSNGSVYGSTKGAVWIAQNMYSGSSNVTSTLCYGCQWDAMCRYIGDSQRTTPKLEGGVVGLTGSVSTDFSKNIYDLAGNCAELTMEYKWFQFNSVEGYPWRIWRGGCSVWSVPVSFRNFMESDPCRNYYGFRTVLYVK